MVSDVVLFSLCVTFGHEPSEVEFDLVSFIYPGIVFYLFFSNLPPSLQSSINVPSTLRKQYKSTVYCQKTTLYQIEFKDLGWLLLTILESEQVLRTMVSHVVRPLFVDRKQKLGIVLNWLQLGICLI
jgi:hypothetical protein